MMTTTMMIRMMERFTGNSLSDVPVFVPGSEAERMRVPRLRLKAFLSDFDDPARLLEMEAGPGPGAGADGKDADPLASEPCAVLDVRVALVAAGGDSPFLPEVTSSSSSSSSSRL